MLRNLFAREVYIRLSNDDSAFFCTVQRGLFRSRPAEVPIEKAPACVDRPASEPCSSDLLNPKVQAKTNRFLR
jgi:hypothetical protein